LSLNEAQPLELLKKRYIPRCQTSSAGYHAKSIDASVIGHLHHSAHTKRPQSGVIERGGTADVCDPNAGVVNHFAPQSMLVSSNFEGDNVAVMHGWITLHVGNCTWSERCQQPTVDHRVCSSGQISTTP